MMNENDEHGAPLMNIKDVEQRERVERILSIFYFSIKMGILLGSTLVAVLLWGLVRWILKVT